MRGRLHQVPGWTEPASEERDFCHVVVLRVAWTVADLADLAGRSVPHADDVAEALGMRLQRVAA